MLFLCELMSVDGTAAVINEIRLTTDQKHFYSRAVVLRDGSLAQFYLAKRRTDVVKAVFGILEEFADQMRAPARLR